MRGKKGRRVVVFDKLLIISAAGGARGISSSCRKSRKPESVSLSSPSCLGAKPGEVFAELVMRAAASRSRQPTARGGGAGVEVERGFASVGSLHPAPGGPGAHLQSCPQRRLMPRPSPALRSTPCKQKKGGFPGGELKERVSPCSASGSLSSAPSQFLLPGSARRCCRPGTDAAAPGRPRSFASSQDGIQQKDMHNLTGYYSLNNAVIRSLEIKRGGKKINKSALCLPRWALRERWRGDTSWDLVKF